MKRYVYVTMVIDATIEQAWSVLRDFNGLPDYHPMFVESTIEENKPPDQIGCVRNFSDQDGDRVREQLLALSDREHYYTYRILEGGVPASNYIAQMRLWPVTESNQTFGEWWAEFEVEEANAASVVERVTETFRQGFKSVSDRFK